MAPGGDPAHVRAERHGPVAVITLDRPETANGFDPPMARALRTAVRDAAQDPAVGCVVLTGAGRAFCAGGDLAAMRAAADKPALFRALTSELHPAVLQLATMPKPAIAAVNGAAAGGGLGLALACDVRLASERARFKAAYLTLGVVPDGGTTWTLPRVIGPGPARRMILLDEPVDAAQAAALGLADGVVPAERLLEEALALGRRLAALPRFAAGEAKRLLAAAGAGEDFAAHLEAEAAANARSAGLPDLAEGLAAFEAKRPPAFPSAAGPAAAQP